MATELAKAYVQIIPSARGIKGMLQNELGGEAAAAGESAGKSFGGGLLSGLAGIGKAAAAALGAATAAVGAFAKSSLDAYGEFEQLADGAKLMFGNAFEFVSAQASNAYKTVQMSQNDYLRQMNGFATGLKTALGGNEQAAAHLADKIITAEADIVAATGNSQEAVQNAFNGIMRSNYTMLDNLQLGITPTKAGFQEVIDKVNEWNAANGNATNYMIDNLADAQSALVDYVAMQGLAGYASAEAAGTIQGSLASVGAAWQNLMVGIADENANLPGLIENLLSSITEAAQNNILPRFQQILKGIGNAVSDIAPVIAVEVPSLIQDVLPFLLEAGTQLLGGVIQGFTTALPDLTAAALDIIPTLIDSIVQALPALASGALQIVEGLANGIMEALPLLAQAAMDIIGKLTEGLSENLPMMIEQGLQMLLSFSGSLRENAALLVDAAITLIQTLADGLIEALPAMIETIPLIVSNIANIINDNAPKLLETAAELIWKLVTGLIDNIPVILENMPQIIAAVWDTIRAVNWLDLGSTLIDGIAGGISSMTQMLKETVQSIMQHPLDFLTNLRTQFQSLGRNLIQFFSSGISGMIQTVLGVIHSIGTSITNSILNLVHSASGWGVDMIQGFINGISSMISRVVDTVKGLADKVRSFLHFSRPDEGPLRDYETWMPDFMAGLAQGIDANVWRVQKAVKGLAQDMTLDLSPSVRMPSLHAAAVADAGAALGGQSQAGGGTVTNLYQTIYTHDSLSESELTREAEDMLARGRWKNP